MIHIAFDTSGIGKNRSLKDANYKALQRLIEAAKITVHIPYVVKRELETQEKDYYIESYKEFKKALRKFNSVQKPQDLYEKINQIKTEIDNLDNIINIDAERFSKSWIEGLNSHITDITPDQAVLAWESYFDGTYPLTSKKDRKDIPDSFICRSIEHIKQQVGSLVVIAHDGKVYNTFLQTEDYQVYKEIREFIALPEIQTLLEELDTITGLNIVQSKINNLSEFVKYYEHTARVIHDFLETDIGEAIIDKKVYDIPLSNEMDGEATISSYGNGRLINIQLDSPIHYGENQIGFAFDLEIYVNIDYFIDKSDYYTECYGADSAITNVSVDDWNDHVFEAESEIEIRVKGIVSIKIDPTELDPVEIAKCKPEELDDYFSDLYNLGLTKIESIDEIEVI